MTLPTNAREAYALVGVLPKRTMNTKQPINDGGPAFPVAGHAVDASGAFCDEIVVARGITILDYFATKAMQGIIMSKFGQDFSIRDVADEAYAYGLAMLAARVQPTP